MTRRCLGLALLIMAGLPACGHLSATNRPDRARTIQIAETVTPSTLYASLGEEVRWQNLRANPVRVGFLAMTILDELGCEKGVSTFWGGVSDLVTIP
ncbi:MAG: hypothetical protein OEV08_14485, partial [Nitrospira sp.]|nr:hypothetical protein [Nitrospira sp.]